MIARFNIVAYWVSTLDWIAQFNGAPELLAELHCRSIKDDLEFLWTTALDKLDETNKVWASHFLAQVCLIPDSWILI